MSQSRLCSAVVALAIMGIVFASSPLARAEQKSIATVAERALPAEVKRSGQTAWDEVPDGGEIYLGDTLRTGKGGRLKIIFNDKSIMILAEDTTLEVTQHVYDPDSKENSSLFKLYEGKVRAIVGELFGPQSKFEIQTPVAVAGVKGTDFETHHPKPCTTVYTQAGDSYAKNVDPGITGQVVVPSGFLTTICQGQKPTEPVVASSDFLEGTIPLRGSDTTRPGIPPTNGLPPFEPRPNVPPTSGGGLPSEVPAFPPPPKPIVNNTLP